LKKQAALQIQPGTEPIIEMLEELGFPVTRENYLNMAYPGNLPEWTPELEAELPQELQDFSKISSTNPEDPRIAQLDPSDPSYDTVLRILKHNPELTVEELKELGEIHGFTFRQKS